MKYVGEGCWIDYENRLQITQESYGKSIQISLEFEMRCEHYDTFSSNKWCNILTLSTGVKYSATPSAVPFTELKTLCIVRKLALCVCSMCRWFTQWEDKRNNWWLDVWVVVNHTCRAPLMEDDKYPKLSTSLSISIVFCLVCFLFTPSRRCCTDNNRFFKRQINFTFSLFGTSQ